MGYLNPLLDLPEIQEIITKGRKLSPGERDFLMSVFSAVRQGANREAAFGSIPGDVLAVMGALRVGEALAIIGAALAIRFGLQLIPFVRLGS